MNTSNSKNRNTQSIKNVMLRSALLLSFLLSVTSSVQADGGRDRDNRGEWKLGNHNEIYQRTHRGWQRVQGSAIAVADGWVIGTDRRSGGYGIYRWNGRYFERMPGGAVNIGGSYERPWVINNRSERFEWTGRDWRELRDYGSRRAERDNRGYNSKDNDDHDRRDSSDQGRRDDRRRPSW